MYLGQADVTDYEARLREQIAEAESTARARFDERLRQARLTLDAYRTQLASAQAILRKNPGNPDYERGVLETKKLVADQERFISGMHFTWVRPEPALPPDPDLCDTYARFMCDYGKANRGNVKIIPECDPAVVGRCQELVERVQAGEVNQFQARMGAARISLSPGEQAHDITTGRFEGSVGEAVVATAPGQALDLVAAAAAARRAATLRSWAVRGVVLAILSGVGYWWWSKGSEETT